MKVYYHTWKHGFEQTLVYHGMAVRFDHNAATMVIDAPVLESGLGLATVVQLINTDEVTVERCVAVGDPEKGIIPCQWHDENTPEKIWDNLTV